MAKIKFGQRLIRGLVYGLAVGGTMFMVINIMGIAVNTIAGSEVVNTTGLSLMSMGLGIFAGVGIELSKDFENE